MAPIYLYDIIQGEQEWFDCRLGKPGGTSFSEIIKQDGKPSASQTKLMYRLAGEILSGETPEFYENGHMRRGKELEPIARKAYEIIKDVDVVEVGYVYADERKMYGVSPDGIIGDNGLVEIKSPSSPVHVEYLDKGVLPSAYFHQVQGQLMVCDREYCDFMSYHPQIKPFIMRVYRNEEFIANMRSEVEKFCEKLQALVARLS